MFPKIQVNHNYQEQEHICKKEYREVKMNIDNKFDQVFKGQLHNYEEMPPESVWENIQSTGLNTSVEKSSNWRWWAAASVLALLLSTTAYIYNQNKTEETPEIIANNQSSNDSGSLEANNNNTNYQEKTSETTHPKTIIVTENSTLPKIIKENSFNDETIIEEVDQMVFEETVIKEETQIAEENIQLDESITETPKEINAIESQTIIHDSFVSRKIEEKNDQTKPTKAGRDFFDDDDIDDMLASHKHKKHWILGIEFSPEWITIPENNNNIQSYGLDLSAKYFINKVFIESGLGIAMSKDNGDYNVEYQEAIFKGAYEDVYEVTFETIDGIVIPTYHTKSVNVYDTIDKVTVEEVKNTYVYLNIPLNVGYAVKLGDKFDLYAKTGLNAGIKVYEDIPTPTISGENVNIKRLTPLYHTRTDWNLQAQINIGLDYHITNKFLFGIEPNARYYIKSLVENNDAGNPYGFGVKLGFKYILK